jgi:hypothetical protein
MGGCRNELIVTKIQFGNGPVSPLRIFLHLPEMRCGERLTGDQSTRDNESSAKNTCNPSNTNKRQIQ